MHGKTLTLFTNAPTGSPAHDAAETFAERLAEVSEGQLEIQLNIDRDIDNPITIQRQVTEGEVDMALLPLSSENQPGLDIANLPYVISNYQTARALLIQGGLIHQTVDAMLLSDNLKILAPFPLGMVGAGFVNKPQQPTNPNVEQNLTIRIPPNEIAYSELMSTLGFETQEIPWIDTYTAMSNGTVDGMIGDIPKTAHDHFLGVLNTWVQYNNRIDTWWFYMHRRTFNLLSTAEQQFILNVATEIANDRFTQAETEDNASLVDMRLAGIEVIRMSDEELSGFVRSVQRDVWPQINIGIDAEVMGELRVTLE